MLVRASIVALAGCNAALPSPAPPGQRVTVNGTSIAVAGETLEYRVQFRGMHVGTVQTAIGMPGVIDGRRAIRAHTRARTDGVIALFGEMAYELDTTIDLDTGYPIEDRERGEATFAGKTERDHSEHVWSDGDHRHDLHSAIGALRGWSSRPGERVELDVVFGGGHSAVELWPSGREAVRATPALRYTGVTSRAKKLAFTAWFSDDATRAPLAFRARTPVGDIAIDLVEYELPRQ
jgi:hypothetical protein